MIAFRPLIPRLHEYKTMTLGFFCVALNGRFYMSAEQLRCRSFKNQAVGSTARRVVPVRYNAGIAFYPADRFCYNVLNGVFVLVDSRKILPVRVPIFQLAYWVLPGGPLFHVEPSRRQARDDHRIETRVFRVPVG